MRLLLPLRTPASGLLSGCDRTELRCDRFCELVMKFCPNCNRVAPGNPPYCPFCGRTYSIRLCPRGHVSPRSAQFCSSCGSSELSSPAPKVPVLVRPVLLALRVPPVLVLIFLLVVGSYFLAQMLNDRNVLAYLTCIGLALTAIIIIWMNLPDFLKEVLKWIFLSSSKDGGHRRS